MVTITARYDGSLRCTARHGPSDSTLETDAPVDNHGRGESFSPTDLLATSLLTCAMTTMAIAAKRANIPLGDISGTVEKHMVTVPNRRVGALPIRLTVHGSFTPEQKKALENAARTCPVASSIHPNIDAAIAFAYPDDRT
jgi:putative redox protein